MEGYGAYSHDDATSYDTARQSERIWHAENAYVARLLEAAHVESVLDVPVGTGRFLDLYGNSRVVGVDLSDAMLAEAARKAKRLGRSDVQLLRASVSDLPFSNAEFDLVVCWRLLHLLPESALPTALHELGRVCRGTLCIQAYVQAPPLKRLAAKFRRHVLRLRRAFQTTEPLTPWSHIAAFDHSLATLEMAAAEAGLGRAAHTEDLGPYEGTRVLAMIWTRK